MNDNSQPNRLIVAEIGPPHGVRGAVKCRLLIDDPDLIRKNPNLYTSAHQNQTITLTLQKPTEKGWLATLGGVTDRDQAEKWRGTSLYLDRAALPDLDDDDGYYITDLVDLRVISASGVALGTVAAVDNFGASDLLDIAPPIGPNYYLPFTDDTVLSVDIPGGTITVQNHEPYATVHITGDNDKNDHEQDNTKP
jgi:16S rRNA processing protein RimM